MTNSDTITNDENFNKEINEIRGKLKRSFYIETEYLGDGVIAISELNGYINSDNTYIDIEYLGDKLIQWLRNRYDYDFDFSILENGHELSIKVI